MQFFFQGSARAPLAPPQLRHCKLRMMSHKIKQINVPLRFTQVVFACLFKVINISSLFKTNSAYTFTNKTTQNYGRAIQPYIVFWDTTNLKAEYAFGTIWDSTIALSKHRAMQNIKSSLFQIPNRWK